MTLDPVHLKRELLLQLPFLFCHFIYAFFAFAIE